MENTLPLAAMSTQSLNQDLLDGIRAWLQPEQPSAMEFLAMEKQNSILTTLSLEQRQTMSEPSWAMLVKNPRLLYHRPLMDITSARLPMRLSIVIHPLSK